MQKMRVSTMKITKKENQQTVQLQTEIQEVQSRRATPERLSLQERMRKVAKEKVASIAKPVQERALQSKANRSSGQRVEETRPLRRDMLVQVAVCSMVLVSVLGFRAIDTPFTNSVTKGLSQAVSMEVDISKSLGKLQFVREIVPESVLTFWEATQDSVVTLYAPIDGDIAVEFGKESQGLLLVGPDQAVHASLDGVVESITRGKDGDYVLKIKHSGQLQTVYGFLQGVQVAVGDTVTKGQKVALALPSAQGAQLYFQVLRSGVPFDPVTLFER